MAKVTQCADCGRELTEYERLYHHCWQQALANRRAQARHREQAAVPVLQVKCRCGAVATEYDAAADLLLCTGCWDAEEQAQADAARDCAELRDEVQREPRR